VKTGLFWKTTRQSGWTEKCFDLTERDGFARRRESDIPKTEHHSPETDQMPNPADSRAGQRFFASSATSHEESRENG